MSTKFFTNQKENTLFNKLEGVFKHNQSIDNFDVLVGIEADEITQEMQADGLSLFKGDAKKNH